jgi:hypothetical protein
MSKVQVDKVVNLSDDGAPQLTYGAELPVGYGLTGAGGLNISGVVTAASAVFSGNVTIGGTLTYEDVTNIDVVGVSTFAGRMNVNSTLEANEGINVTAGVGTFAGNVKVGSACTITTGAVLSLQANSAPQIKLLDNNNGFAATQLLVENGGRDFKVTAPQDTIFVQGSTESARIDANGRLGVGDDSPDTPLHVKSADNILATFESTDADSLIEFKDNGTSDTILIGALGGDDLMLRCDAGAIRFYTANNTEKIRVSSAGSFAIGDTTEPGAKLYVNGVSTNDIITARAADTNGVSAINILSEGTTGVSRIKFSDTAANDGLISYTHSSRQLQFAAGGTSPQVYVNRTGELLVGTATTFGSDSARKLQLENDSTGPVIALKTDNNNPNADTFFGGIENISLCNGVNTINSAIYFDADATHSGSNGPGRIELHTNSGNSLLERVRVDSNGYVGIKLSDPHLYYSKDLVVQAISQGGITVRSSSTTDTNYLMFADGTSGNERYRGYIGYSHNTGADGGEHMQFAASGGTGLMRFYADGIALGGETATANRLNDYEEGDFTPTLGHSHTATEADGKYTKVGNMCIAAMSITLPTTSNANHLVLGSLPFTAAGGRPGAAILRYSNSGTAYLIAWHVNAGESSVAPYYGNGGSVVTYAEQSAKRFDLTFVYRTA